MAAFSLCCPKCDTILNLATRPAEGKKVKCPKCSAIFVAADNEAPGKATAIKPASDRPAVPAASKGRPARDENDDDDKSLRRRPSRADIDDEDEADERPRRGKGNRRLDEADDDRPLRSGKKQKSNAGLIIGLCAGVGVLFLACAGTAGGVIWWLTKSQPASVAKGPENKPVAQQVGKDPKVQPPNNANVAQPPAPGPGINPPGNTPTNKPKRPRRKPPVKPADPPPQPAPQPAPVQQPDPAPQPAPQPEPAKLPEPPPQPAPPPVVGPVDLDKALLAKTSRATAFIRVDVGKETATGSGFLVKSTGDTAYIITNFHVIDVEEKAAPKPGGPGMQWRFGRRMIPGPPRMGPRGRRPAPPPKAERRVTVVFNSGTPNAQALPAEVVATDDESDLAALRVSGARNLPEALDISQEAGVVEQQPVYIFGFPANKRPAGPGYPPVNVEKGTVAGLRRDAGNNLIDVHINGDLNPGNSGGPIIDANGRLVGISVAAVLGKQIGFAIPAGVLHQMFKGRLSRGVVFHIAQKGPQLNLSGEIWAYDHKSTVRGRKAITIPLSDLKRGTPPPPADQYRVLGVLADPMLKIKGAKAYFAVTEKVASPPNGQPWAKMPTRFPPIALKIEDQFASGSFTLPKEVVPDRMFAFQFSYVNADNKTIFTQPHLVRLTFPQNTLSVTINISGIPDEPTRRYIEDSASKILPGKVRVVSWSKDKLVLEADPVPDPSVIAPKITFGEVTSVQGRTFTITAKKIDLPPPTDAEVASALTGLKSNNKQQRIAAADKLAKVYAILPERRAEVAKALEPLAGDKDIWVANPALRALQLWAGPENVAAVIPAAGNNFTCGEAIKVLAHFKTAEVADALAKVLPNGIARGPAAAALKKMGPIAEKAVLPFVNQGFWVGMEACNILKEIGTAECIPVLTQAVNDPKYAAKNAAQQALKSVQARVNRGAGG